MNKVHVFISTGRFNSFEEIRRFIDEAYSDDGDGIPSAFMKEVGLEEYEPGCIEAILSNSGHPVPLSELLRGSSYWEQWSGNVDLSKLADAAICVFPPNRLKHPENASLEYLGAYKFTAED